MIKELILQENLALVGEEVGLELGTQMVKSYREANPTDVKWYMVGREIIEQILAQPGCVGLKFYNAFNEAGQKTVVYVGVNQDGQAMLEFSAVSTEGVLSTQKGIVADRVRLPTFEEENIFEDNIFGE